MLNNYLNNLKRLAKGVAIGILLSKQVTAQNCSVNVTATDDGNGHFIFTHSALPAGFNFNDPNNYVGWHFGDYASNPNGYYVGSNTNTLDSISHTYLANGTYVVSFAVSDSSGSSGCTRIEGIATVTVTGLAVSSTCPINVTAVDNGNGDFTFTHDALPSGFNFNDPNNFVGWDFGDGSGLTTSTSNTLDVINHTFASNGTYTVQFVVADSSGLSGCSRIEGSITVVVNDSIAPCNINTSFSLEADSSTTDTDDYILTDANGFMDYSYVTIFWGDGSSDLVDLLASAYYPTHTYANGGQYTINIVAMQDTAIGGCSDSTTLTVNLRTAQAFAIKTVKFVGPTGVTALKTVASQQIVKGLYPNPANDFVTITLATELTNAVVNVYDVIGNLILSEKATGAQTQLNTTDIANGIYSVVITNGNAKATSKIVVAH